MRQKASAFFNEAVYNAARSRVTSKSASENDTMKFDGMIDLLLGGITDVWSAIRKESAKAATKAVAIFPTSEIFDRFINRLLSILTDLQPTDSQERISRVWTEQEGALITIAQLLHFIVKDKPHQRSKPTVTYLVGQQLQLPRLPQVIAVSLKPAAYRLLQHDQLAVRQGAADCLAAFAHLCEEPARIGIFQEAISKLNRIPHEHGSPSMSEQSCTSLLDAFVAEGLLDLLSRIVIDLPPQFLTKHWKFVFGTLERYMAHTASSVRQCCSSVFAALTKLSLACYTDLVDNSASAAFQLLLQVMLSLSSSSEVPNTHCWQKSEGRLLCIEAVAELFGKRIIQFELWGFDESTLQPQVEARSNEIPEAISQRWAHEQLAASTWVIEPSTQPTMPFTTSVIEQLDRWISGNNGSQDLPKSSSLFWQQVLGGWLSHTLAAVLSPQFELRRISTQVLPSLVRLCIWLQTLDTVHDMLFSNVEPKGNMSGWYCGKSLILHLRFLRECEASANRELTRPQLALSEEVAWRIGLRLLRNSRISHSNTEEAVAMTEMLAMLLIHFEPSHKPPEQLLEILDTLLSALHENLPSDLRSIHADTKPLITIDRQICVSLIKILPAIVSATTRLAVRNTSEFEQLLSPEQRWIALGRVALAWISSEDMKRWITLPKSAGRMQLLAVLLMLMKHQPKTLSPPEILAEYEFNIRCTSNIPDHPEVMCEFYLSMWSQWCDRVELAIDEFVCSLAKHFASTIADANIKTIEDRTTAEWDDWDEEETRVPATTCSKDLKQEQATLGGLDFSQVVMEKSSAIRLLDAVRNVQDRTGQSTEHQSNLKLLGTALEQWIPRLS